jgi:hypothetical protein
MITSKLNRFSDREKSLLINAFIAILWWLAFNPGFYSGDSFGVIEMARSGNISSDSTAIWAIAVKFLTINGSHPELATLFFSQLLAFSITMFAHSIFNGKRAAWGSAVLCATPLVGAMGITLWHDIPMTSGFLLVATGCLRYVRKEPHAIVFLTFGLVFSSFRYNGIPTILISLILLTIFFRPKKFVFIALALTIGIGGLTTGLDARFSPQTSTHSDGLINWMRYDLSCYAATFSDEDFFLEEFSGKTTLEFWSSSQACNWFNDSEAFFKRPANLTENIPSAWLALTLKEPLFVLTTHMKRHEYLNPLPFYGPPSMPFIHTTIESPEEKIYFLNADLSEQLRIYPRIWNYFNFIFGYSGFWLMIIFVLAWRKRNPMYFGLGVLGLVLNGGLFVFAIISDARFSLFVLISSQLIVLVEFLDYFKRKWQSKFFKDFVEVDTHK